MKEDDELLARVLAGEGSPDEIAGILKAADQEPGLKRRLADLAAIDAMLGIAAEDEFSSERRLKKTMDFLREKEQEDFVTGIQGRLHSRRNWSRGVAAAAAAVALLGAGWFFMTSRPVATVVRAETSDWLGGEALKEGSRLKAGSHVSFGQGLVEIKFGKRASMIVEGPADLEMLSKDESYLSRGRVVVRNEPDSDGFQVATSRGSVRAGSNFAISAGDDSRVEVVSFGRDISFTAKDGAVLPVRSDESLKLGQDDKGAAGLNASFYTSLPPRHGGDASFVHWSLDDNSGGRSPVLSRGISGPPVDLHLHGHDGGRPPFPVAGRFGGALEFDGLSSYAESPFRGIAGGDARTVCFWVKVPQDFSSRQGFAVVSWGNFNATNPGAVWQISVNPLVEDGPMGRIRVGTHLGQIVGSSDLRDGQWHHVAIVLYGGLSPDIGTHVLAYIDGDLEPISTRTLGPVRTDVDADHGVWIGRNIVDSESTARNHGHFFRGGVDEVYIIQAALSREEIRQLKDKNTLPR